MVWDEALIPKINFMNNQNTEAISVLDSLISSQVVEAEGHRVGKGFNT